MSATRPLWSLALLALALAGCPRSSPTPPAEAPERPAAAPAETATAAATAPTPPPAPKRGGEGEPCASGAACQDGLRCTTDDGDCDAPPGCEPGDICPTVCYGVCAPAGDPSAAACDTDADCEPVAHYCDGCHCLARRADAPAPKCTGRKVACIANPCEARSARCVEGGCRLVEAAPE